MAVSYPPAPYMCHVLVHAVSDVQTINADYYSKMKFYIWIIESIFRIFNKYSLVLIKIEINNKLNLI